VILENSNVREKIVLLNEDVLTTANGMESDTIIADD
jgi:hypothetical protein